MKTIIIGTRGSKLALYQARLVQERLQQAHPHRSFELRVIRTQGDKRQDLSLIASGDKGLFTREIEQELREGRIDIAVHSLKDLPVEPALGTSLGAILPREETADVVIGRHRLADLPEGAVVGTSSRRREHQLLLHYPHLRVSPIRGNVDTRIAKQEAGEYDAILMAWAGIRRMELGEKVCQILPEGEMVPAPGQAAIAVQQRLADQEISALLHPLHDPITALEVETERGILQALGGGCALPLGCVVHIVEEKVHLRAFYANQGRHLYIERTGLVSEIGAISREVVSELKRIDKADEE